MTEKKELSVVEQYHGLAQVDRVAEVIEANMGACGGSIDLFGLERIKLGAGGVKGFIVESDVGEDAEHITEFDALVTDWTSERVYWQASFDASGGGSPPDCTSTDLIYGSGDNGTGAGRHECDFCAMNQWKSDPKGGKGKACRELRKLFILRRKDNLFPSLMIIPPGSLRNITHHMQSLLGRGVPFYALMHTFYTTVETSATGVKYTQAHVRMGRVLDNDDVRMIKKYREALSSVLRSATVRADEVSGD